MSKNYDELTITDSYLFYRIMRSNPDICKEFIQRLLDIKISKIEYINAEETIDLDYEKKGIRLDVYLEDSDKIFDIEMQTYILDDINLRMRYYQGLIDLNQLEKGADVSKLKESYILFLTNTDYYKMNFPCYTFRLRAEEDKNILADDKSYKIVYNFNRYKEIKDSEKRKLLGYLCTKQSCDTFTEKLDSLVFTAKRNEPWRKQYMTWELMKHDIARENIAKGMELSKIEIAKKLISRGLPLEQISEDTGLPLQEVESLKIEINTES